MKALLGDYPVTKLFKEKSSLEFADVKVPNTAFKRVVRELEFDVAELALMTFLLAKAHGKPYRLLPAVVTARFQHSTLAYNPERGKLSPEQARRAESGDAFLFRHHRDLGARHPRRRLRRRPGQGELGDLRRSARRGVPRPAECDAHAGG